MITKNIHKTLAHIIYTRYEYYSVWRLYLGKCLTSSQWNDIKGNGIFNVCDAINLFKDITEKHLK